MPEADVGDVTGFYGRWAGLYDLIARYTPGIASIRTRAAEALALSPGETVVEMGCGTGANLPYLRERVGDAGRVVGVDLTPGMLGRARRRVERAGWRNVHLLRGDAARAPLREADAVLATFVVGMLEDPAAAIEGWFDRLPTGGRIALVDAARSGRPAARPANALFRAFVTATSPPGTRLRYEESPVVTLDRRVEAARAALAERGTVDVEERFALGFIRLAAARKA